MALYGWEHTHEISGSLIFCHWLCQDRLNDLSQVASSYHASHSPPVTWVHDIPATLEIGREVHYRALGDVAAVASRLLLPLQLLVLVYRCSAHR